MYVSMAQTVGNKRMICCSWSRSWAGTYGLHSFYQRLTSQQNELDPVHKDFFLKKQEGTILKDEMLQELFSHL